MIITLQPTQFNIEKFLNEIDMQVEELRKGGCVYFWIYTSSFIYNKLRRLKKYSEYTTNEGDLKYKDTYIVVRDYALGEHECRVEGSIFPYIPVNPSNKEMHFNDFIEEMNRKICYIRCNGNTKGKIKAIASDSIVLTIYAKRLDNIYTDVDYVMDIDQGEYQMELTFGF